jgi:hypothetical protein
MNVKLGDIFYYKGNKLDHSIVGVVVERLQNRHCNILWIYNIAPIRYPSTFVTTLPESTLSSFYTKLS